MNPNPTRGAPLTNHQSSTPPRLYRTTRRSISYYTMSMSRSLSEELMDRLCTLNTFEPALTELLSISSQRHDEKSFFVNRKKLPCPILGQCPLLFCCQLYREDLAIALLASCNLSTNVNAVDPNGYSVLHYTVQGQMFQLLKVLLTTSTCPDVLNLDSQTTQDIRLGMDIETGGRTALHLAAIAGQEDMIEALVRAGACLEIRDFDGRCALEVLSTASSLEVRQLLQPKDRIGSCGNVLNICEYEYVNKNV